jgi:hypothetical protein
VIEQNGSTKHDIKEHNPKPDKNIDDDWRKCP